MADLSTVCLLAMLSVVLPATYATIALRDYALDDFCGETLDISEKTYVNALQLNLMPYSSQYYNPNMACGVHIKAPYGKRILILFESFDITHNYPCEDYLEIYDSATPSPFQTKLLDKTCGYVTPSNIESSGRDVYIYFQSDSYDYDRRTGFKMIITSFEYNSYDCSGFLCSNSRCIDSSLSCNFQDNCGDNSNNWNCGGYGGGGGDDGHYFLRNAWWIILLICLSCLIFIAVIVVTVICCCCKKRPGYTGNVIQAQRGPTVIYQQGVQTVGNPWYGPSTVIQSAPPAYTPNPGLQPQPQHSMPTPPTETESTPQEKGSIP